MNTNDNISVDQVREIAMTLVGAISTEISSSAGLHWAGSQALLTKRISEILSDDGSVSLEQTLLGWRKLYRDFFSIEKSFSGMFIPQKPAGCNRLIVCVKELSPDHLLRTCQNVFLCEYHPLAEFGETLSDRAMVANDSRSDCDYAFWTPDTTESQTPPGINEDLKMTLFERLLFELKYFSENGIHLDNKKVTCCFGTRHVQGGERPVVCFRQGRVQILWQASDYTHTLMGCSPHWSRKIVM